MCKVYNTVGSLTVIKDHLAMHNMCDFRSVNELLNFRKNYLASQQQITLNHQQIIQTEKDNLYIELQQLNNLIDETRKELEHALIVEREHLLARIDSASSHSSPGFRRLISYFKRVTLKTKVHLITRDFKKRITSSLHPLVTEYQSKETRLNFIATDFHGAITQSAEQELEDLNRKKNVIDQIYNYIYGAIGEQKVADELEKLPNEFVLINDFTLSFHPAIYHRQNNDYINSIQVDHILISRSGIFLIETKNWSKESLENLNLYSPVQQIKRANFALYKLLNERLSVIDSHHWGERKIPIRNLIVLIKRKPVEEFQYVKVLTLGEMLNYIRYFQPCFSISEVRSIAERLLSINKTYVD